VTEQFIHGVRTFSLDKEDIIDAILKHAASVDGLEPDAELHAYLFAPEGPPVEAIVSVGDTGEDSAFGKLLASMGGRVEVSR
jgi:hypothetical protein